METKPVSGIVLTLLLIGMLALAFNIQPVKAIGTIYIRADGSVYPPTAPISSVDNITYTFTDNINDSIVVERSNITVDGSGFTLQGSADKEENGFSLCGVNNITIQNTDITGFALSAIFLNSSSRNKFAGNALLNNGWGISMYSSSFNIISYNNVSWSGIYGIKLEYSSRNIFASNNITSNGCASGLCGVDLINSNDNNFSRNLLYYNYGGGFWLTASNNNLLDTNEIVGGSNLGISLYRSGNNTLVGNNVSNSACNFEVEGDISAHFENNIDTSNTVDGKPIYYLLNTNNSIIGAETNAGVIYLIHCDNVTIKDVVITRNYGPFFWNTTNLRIENITVSWCYNGLKFRNCNYTTTVSSNFLNNYYSVSGGGYNNRAYHNNYINNGYQLPAGLGDNGYPSGGNYWSNYVGVDLNHGSGQNITGGDGIGDTPYIYSYSGNVVDRYPLMGPFNTFDSGTWNAVAYNVDVVSNSTLSAFTFSTQQKLINFNATGSNGTRGFCRVTIPKELLWVDYQALWIVIVGDEPVAPTVIEDVNCTYLYFTYSHSTKTVQIMGTGAVPEFASTIILPLLFILAFLIIISSRRRIHRKPKT